MARLIVMSHPLCFILRVTPCHSKDLSVIARPCFGKSYLLNGHLIEKSFLFVDTITLTDA